MHKVLQSERHKTEKNLQLGSVSVMSCGTHNRTSIVERSSTMPTTRDDSWGRRPPHKRHSLEPHKRHSLEPHKRHSLEPPSSAAHRCSRASPFHSMYYTPCTHSTPYHIRTRPRRASLTKPFLDVGARAVSTFAPPLTDEQRHAWKDTLTRKNLVGGPTPSRVSTAELVPPHAHAAALAAVSESAEALAETTLADVSLTERPPDLQTVASSPMMNNSI